MPFEQAPVNAIHIRSICSEVGADWRDLGAVLGMESALIDDIENNHRECREMAWKVLQKWTHKKGNGATMGILINALKKINRRDVVEKMLGM